VDWLAACIAPRVVGAVLAVFLRHWRKICVIKSSEHLNNLKTSRETVPVLKWRFSQWNPKIVNAENLLHRILQPEVFCFRLNWEARHCLIQFYIRYLFGFHDCTVWFLVPLGLLINIFTYLRALPLFCAAHLEQTMGARNRVGLGLSFRIRFLGIDYWAPLKLKNTVSGLEAL
jgi:hypothetical protein